ncbi:MAG: hypothetical protein IT428_11235 [Planctomycetaceae bacterium]|nr:hypothetical protein [Planctomycetaceae bacterium]
MADKLFLLTAAAAAGYAARCWWRRSERRNDESFFHEIIADVETVLRPHVAMPREQLRGMLERRLAGDAHDDSLRMLVRVECEVARHQRPSMRRLTTHVWLQSANGLRQSSCTRDIGYERLPQPIRERWLASENDRHVWVVYDAAAPAHF